MKGNPLATLAIGLTAVSPAAPATVAGNSMPAAQQNRMVQTYCAVCHTDAHPGGGLSLEHFDATHSDPGRAAMIVSELKSRALGASGHPLPDRATQDALFNAMSAEAVGANRWIVEQTQMPALLATSIVQEVPASTKEGDPDLYRLTLTFNIDTHQPEMQLAWSPGVPKSGQIISAAVDGKTRSTYKVEGTETMGNGQAGTSGPGAILRKATRLPKRTLTISNVFANETVAFPFGSLTGKVRKSLSTCFVGK